MNIVDDTSSSPRRYRQRARAESSARTRAAILDAAVALALEKTTADMSLADVARRADVSVQTVLRHFGSREALLDAALEHGNELVETERRAPDGDIPHAVRALFAHYEERGDGVIRLLGQEDRDPRIALVTQSGRRVHREWVTHLLPPGSALREKSEIVDQLVVVTDVYAWKILRRDRRLSLSDAEARVRAMIEAILSSASAAEERSA